MAFSSVLIVDDEPGVRELMSRWVSALGLEARTAGSADEALAYLHDTHYDLAVVDVRMPGRNGLWLADNLRRECPGTAVVLATAYTELLDPGLPSPPVADLLIKPFRRDRFVEAIGRGRAWQEKALAELAWHEQLLDEVRLSLIEARRHVAHERARGAAEADTLLDLLKTRLPDVHEHSERVGAYAVDLASTLELPAEMIAWCGLTGRLHDVGKLAIPVSLLAAPGQLRPGEIAIIRQHVEAGAEMLGDTLELAELAPFVRASHEWFGGGGYPESLSGGTIPLVSRIIAVVDAYDAMTNDRCYRGGVDIAVAAAELLRCTPRQFDPEIVVPFLATLSGGDLVV